MFLSKNHDQHKISKNIEWNIFWKIMSSWNSRYESSKTSETVNFLLYCKVIIRQNEFVWWHYFSEYVSIFFEMFLWYNTFFTNSYQMMVKQQWELTRVDENCLTLGCMNCHREHFKQQNDEHFEHFLTFKKVYVK